MVGCIWSWVVASRNAASNKVRPPPCWSSLAPLDHHQCIALSCPASDLLACRRLQHLQSRASAANPPLHTTHVRPHYPVCASWGLSKLVSRRIQQALHCRLGGAAATWPGLEWRAVGERPQAARRQPHCPQQPALARPAVMLLRAHAPSMPSL